MPIIQQLQQQLIIQQQQILLQQAMLTQLQIPSASGGSSSLDNQIGLGAQKNLTPKCSCMSNSTSAQSFKSPQQNYYATAAAATKQLVDNAPKGKTVFAYICLLSF